MTSEFLREMELKDRDFRMEVFDYPGYRKNKGEIGSRADRENPEINEYRAADHGSRTKPAFPRLMTGADLLKGGGNSVDLPQGFQLGQAVRHPRYGLGVVIEIGGFGRRRTVTVEFQKDSRQETFVAAKCPLQPVNSP
jgi:ATP-dependent DNA helicase UvrD/PcrA